METFFVILLFASGLFTLICAFRYPRTVFGLLLLLGVAYLIAILFALETKNKTLAIAVAVPFVVAFAAYFLHAAYRFANRSDAWAWHGAGMSGAFRLWQRYALTGRQARIHWLLRMVCSLAIACAVTGGLYTRLAGMENPPTNPEAARQRAKIVNKDQVYSSLNESREDWVKWPSAQIQEQAGEKAWGSWRPKNGDEGVVIGTMRTPAGVNIYILEIDAGKDGVHYVAVHFSGVTHLPS